MKWRTLKSSGRQHLTRTTLWGSPLAAGKVSWVCASYTDYAVDFREPVNSDPKCKRCLRAEAKEGSDE